MKQVIQTGRFVILKEKDGSISYLKFKDNNSHTWTKDIKEAAIFASEKLAVMFKYSSSVGDCTIKELVTKPKV